MGSLKKLKANLVQPFGQLSLTYKYICRLPCASEVAEVARSESMLVARLYATVPRAPNI